MALPLAFALTMDVSNFVAMAKMAEQAFVGLVNAVATGIKDLASRGSDIAGVENAFQQLALAAGQSGSDILKATRGASMGMISDFDAMAFANKGLLMGLPITDKDMATLAKTAITLGQAMKVGPAKAMEDLITGLGRGSPLILDNLGIVLNERDAHNEFAASIGKSTDALSSQEKTLAVYNAAMGAAAKRVEEIGGIQVGMSQIVEQLSTAWTNAYDEMARAVADSELLPALKALGEALLNLASDGTLKGMTYEVLIPMIDFLTTAVDGVTLLVDAIGALIQPFKTIANELDRIGGNKLVNAVISGASPILGLFKTGSSGMGENKLSATSSSRGAPTWGEVWGGLELTPSEIAKAKASADRLAKEMAREAQRAAADRLRVQGVQAQLGADAQARGDEIIQKEFKANLDRLAADQRAYYDVQLHARKEQIARYATIDAQEMSAPSRAKKDAEALAEIIGSVRDLSGALGDAGQAMGGLFGGVISLAGGALNVWANMNDEAVRSQSVFEKAAGAIAGAVAAYKSGSVMGGAMAGASAGAAFGGVGALVGGAIGGILGIFGGKKKREEEAKKAAKEAAEADLKAIDEYKKIVTAGLDKAVGSMKGITGIIGEGTTRIGGLSEGDVAARVARYTAKLREAGVAEDELKEKAAARQKELQRWGTDVANVEGGLKITSPEGAAAQAVIFSSTFWAVVKRDGLVAGVDAMSEPFLALKAKLEAGGFDVSGLLGTMGGLFEAVNNEAVRPALEAMDALRQALAGQMDAQMLTAGTFTAFGQAAQDAYAQAVAGGLESSAAIGTMRPLLAEIIRASNEYGYVIDANTQDLINQSIAADGAFPIDPVLQMRDAVRELINEIRTMNGLPQRDWGAPPGGASSGGGEYGGGQRPTKDDFPDSPVFDGGGVYNGPDGGQAFLHRGEGIFTPDQMRALASGGGGGGQPVTLMLESRVLAKWVADSIKTGYIPVAVN